MRTLLTSPAFEDAGRTQTARALYVILWTMILSVTLLLAFQTFILPENAPRWLLIIGGIDGASLALLGLTRRGATRLASVLLIIMLWLITTALAFTAGGVRSSVVTTYLIIVLIAGLLLGHRVSLAAAVVCNLTGLGLASAEAAGVLPPTAVNQTPLSLWTAAVLYTLLIIGLQYLMTSTIQKTLRRAQQELAERKQMEAALRASEERFRALIEHSHDIIGVLSAEGRLEYASPSAWRLVGQPPQNQAARDLSEFLHPDDRPRFTENLRLAIANPGAPLAWTEYRVRDEAGRWRIFEAVGTNLLDSPAVRGIVFNARDVTEHKQADAVLSRQLKETQALFQISQSLAGSLDLPSLLQKIVEAAAGVVERADRVVMHLLDPSRTILQPVAVAGPDRRMFNQRVNFQWGEGIAGLVIASGQAINVADAPADPRYIPLEHHVGRVHALLVAPVYAGETRLGTLSVHSAAVGVFTADDERLLTTLGAQAGLAIEKAWLFEAEHRRVREAEALQQVTRTLINRRPLPELLQEAADAIATIRYKYVTINLREKDKLTPYAWTGYRKEDLRVLSMNEGVVGRVARTGVPALAPDMNLDPDALGVGPGAKSVIGVPLTHADRLLGVLTVVSEAERPLDENDLNWLMNVGRQLSTAIENAQLYADLENALQHEKASRARMVQTEKLAAMGRLVASVAHELNNPIQAIQNALYLIRQESCLSEQTQADVDVVTAETQRMAELINRLRETYRPATSEQFKPLSLNALIEDVHKLISTHLRHSGIAFVFEPDSTLPPARGIRDQLKQAVLNLGLNAAEAMPNGGQLTVQTYYAPGADEIALSITDTGIGIAPEDLANVFDPFFTTKDSGTGLGLAITHDIIQRHGGRIDVTSKAGQGATFTVWLLMDKTPAPAHSPNRRIR